MKANIIVGTLFAIMTTASVMANDDNKKSNPAPDFEMFMLIDAPRPTFMLDGPIPSRHSHMRRGPQFGMGHPVEFPSIDLSDSQRDKFRELGKKHRKDMENMHKSRAVMHERYQEKFEAVLTDEQFRKIEKMRKELRRDMRELDEKQQKLFEQHRHDFESILTKEQKKELQKIRDRERRGADNKK